MLHQQLQLHAQLHRFHQLLNSNAAITHVKALRLNVAAAAAAAAAR
jgi:hypothetical protein